MNQASQWRLEMARDAATWYRSQPGIEMILAGGSAARGCADAFSDLDIAVYWQRLESSWFTEPPLDRGGGQRFKLHEFAPGQVYLEQYRVGDAKVDVIHITRDWWERLIADVVDRADTAPDKQELIDGFLNAAVLHGETGYVAWRSRLLPYPDRLAVHMVDRHLFFYPSWVMKEHDLARRDWLSFYSHLTGAVRNLLGVLAGLNRIYASTEAAKRTSEIFRRLTIAPANLADRVEALWVMDRSQVPDTLATLVSEVIGLVEKHLPQVDVGTARQRIGFEMHPCQSRPDFHPLADPLA